MTTSPPASRPQSTAISLMLLDAASGRPLQTWTFRSQSIVRIGRLDDMDVVLTDPHVSRLHAELHYLDGAWLLKSLGRNGVLVDDRRTESISVQDGMVFRLGVQGPTMSFAELKATKVEENQSCLATFQFDSGLLEQLGIDADKMEEQVRQITEDGGFQQLLEQARALRQKRASQS